MKNSFSIYLVVSILLHSMTAIGVSYLMKHYPNFLMMGGGNGKYKNGGNGKMRGFSDSDGNYSRFIMPAHMEVKISYKSQPKETKAKEDKKKDSSMKIKSIRKDSPKKEEETKMMSSENCKDFPSFGGIGIEMTMSPEGAVIINNVPEYYAAYKAGIRKGDVLITPNTTIRGEVGTPLNVTYSRNGELTTVKIIREKICYAKKETNK